MKIRASIIFAVLLIATTSNAFDGKRKGFVLGGGIGFAPVAHLQTTNDGVEYTTGSFSFGLSVGYGFNERDLLLLDLNIAPHGLPDIPGLTVSQNFLGPCWYRFLSRNPHSPFLIVGGGIVSLATMDTRFHRASDSASEMHYLFGGSRIGGKLGIGLPLLRKLQITAEYWIGSFERKDSKHASQYVANLRLALLFY